MTHYTHISMKERCLIATFLSMDAKIATIAHRAGRHRSTIYREIKRNTLGEHYKPGQAHQLAKERHPHSPNKIDTHHSLNKFVWEGLLKGWSPEQISGRMLFEKKDFYACHESIYRYIYQPKNTGLQQLLFRKRPYRHYQIPRKSRQKAQLLKRSIHYRPKEAMARDTSGHWEGDTINFPKGQASCVTTLVERKSRFTCLLINQNKKSPGVIGRICQAINAAPKKIWISLAFDQGPEFMAFRQLECLTQCKVFFCDPSSPWQRGSNENMNGRLRRFLPKTFKIDGTTQRDLDIIALQVNNTPRKCLGYKTPSEVFSQHSNIFCRTTL